MTGKELSIKDLRILTFGDIHGRDVWKDVIEREGTENLDLIIFLGDYFTSREDISVEIQEENEDVEEQETLQVQEYQDSVTFEKKPSLWQRIKNSKLGRAVSYVFKIRIRIELPNALPEGRGEE